eukprot:1696903-Amphidinium_carterae.1
MANLCTRRWGGDVKQSLALSSPEAAWMGNACECYQIVFPRRLVRQALLACCPMGRLVLSQGIQKGACVMNGPP